MMAIAHATPIALQPTLTERIALALATRISEVVAWRIERRAERLERAAVVHVRRADAASAVDAHRAAAHWLGIR